MMHRLRRFESNKARGAAPIARVTLVATFLAMSSLWAQAQTCQVTGDLLVPGKLGVGTTSPTHTLTVNSGTNITSMHFGANAAFPGGGFLLSTSATQALLAGGAEYATGWIARATEAQIMGGSGGALYFHTDAGLTPGSPYAPTERMRISASGYVGIGTNTPVAKLHVNGGASLIDATDYQPFSGYATRLAPTWGGWARSAVSIYGASNAELAAFGGYGSGGNSIDYAWIGPGASQYASPWMVFRGGSVGIGTTNPTYTLHVNGSFAATSKNFEIDHPTKKGMKLVHSSLEGPEVAVFYRGEAELMDGKTVIQLPEYFEALTRAEGRTVLVTPRFESEDDAVSALAVSAVQQGRFSVRAIDRNNPQQRFYWEVKAVRKDVPVLEAEKLGTPEK